LDWQTGILGRCLAETGLVVARLKANQCYSSEEERARAFVHSGAGCRATYFNHAKTLQSREAIPNIPLVTTKPPIESHEEMLHATFHVRASISSKSPVWRSHAAVRTLNGIGAT
jgi:hypothetical protein